MKGVTVIKCGGSTMEQLPFPFFQTLANLQRDGKPIVIVHGGGPAINAMLQKLNITPQFVDGLRITCEETMGVVEMVLGGTINKELVRRLTQAGAKAWGVSGIDGAMLTAKQTEKPLGLVGEIVQVDSSIPQSILASGYVPVIAPLAVTENGKQPLNVNADVAAGAIAAALGADRLVMVTDVPGILKPGPDGQQTLVTETDSAQIKQWIDAGVIYGGMIPKVQSAMDALAQGVQNVVICRGTADDLVSVCNGQPAGTTIRGGRDNP
ncbi:acetylglutamate kinase [Brevibacillus sp. H7]|uniref:acetylglutamate kinase n=1 Tax=Brevibacillus sp. H7 TaxID=3349138 RepID=UPI003818C04B